MGVAQPTTYSSPSGVYKLSVDPHEQRGRSGASYRFLRSGQELWSGDHDYTLRVVTVTDEGFVVGIAYRDVSQDRDGERLEWAGFFHIVIIDARGQVLLNDTSKRVPHATSTPPLPTAPYAVQLLVDSSHDRFILRLSEDNGVLGEAGWRVYRISTGELSARFRPGDRQSEPEISGGALNAHMVPGTPLILLHWLERGTGDEGYGARFTLSGADARPVWTQRVPQDYHGIELWKSRYMGIGPKDFFEKQPAILDVNEDQTFSLRLFATNERVTFAITQVDDKWDVKEVARLAYAAPDDNTFEPLPKGGLKYLGSLVLTDDSPSAFGEIWDLTFDSLGNLCLFRGTKDNAHNILVVDPTGAIVGERFVSPAAKWFHPDWKETARLGDDRFVLFRKTGKQDEYAAWWVDLMIGKQTRFKDFPSEHVRALGRFPDGGMVVLDSYAPNMMPSARLSCYDAEGRLLWQQRSDNRGQKDILNAGLDDLCVTTNGNIALLGTSAVALVDRNGRLIKHTSLVGLFQGRRGRPNYIDEVIADADGGFLIQDSSTPPLVVRFNSDSTVRSRWSPRHADGRTFDVRGVWVAPNGRLWTSDSRSIMRLTDDGVVDRILGSSSDDKHLERIAGFTVGPHDQLYAVARGTGRVHVFDLAGTLLRICEPDPTDMPGTVDDAFVAVTETGEIYVERPTSIASRPQDEYVHFAIGGERIDIVSFKPHLRTNTYGPGWAFQPGTGYRCGMSRFEGNDALIIVDPPNRLVRPVTKRANGNWFSYAASFAMAPNGSMVVLSSDLDGNQRDYELDLFAPNGDPIRTVTLPRAGGQYVTLACDASRVIVVGRGEVLIVDTVTDRMERWKLENSLASPSRLGAFIVADGTELLLFEALRTRAGKSAIHRYALPASGSGR